MNIWKAALAILGIIFDLICINTFINEEVSIGNALTLLFMCVTMIILIYIALDTIVSEITKQTKEK